MRALVPRRLTRALAPRRLTRAPAPGFRVILPVDHGAWRATGVSDMPVFVVGNSRG